jgi:hypothetical protein
MDRQKHEVYPCPETRTTTFFQSIDNNAMGFNDVWCKWKIQPVGKEFYTKRLHKSFFSTALANPVLF